MWNNPRKFGKVNSYLAEYIISQTQGKKLGTI